MGSSTTSAALLCLLSGVVAAIQTPQTGERVVIEPEKSAEVLKGVTKAKEKMWSRWHHAEYDESEKKSGCCVFLEL